MRRERVEGVRVDGRGEVGGGEGSSFQKQKAHSRSVPTNFSNCYAKCAAEQSRVLPQPLFFVSSSF